MSKKKNKKKNPQPTQALVRLSQCMIVKDEEKNIEKALSWAKNIAFEQIVVDTGSTDRTVEIAKKMGAKVFHFEWINDFSAAKNFAIEQATGNWIAFLDADEYFSDEDAKKLMLLLKKMRSYPEMHEKCLVLNVPLVNLNDQGQIGSIYDQERVFRNIPRARFKGKIHELLDMNPEDVYRVDEITVIHTGYSESVYEETGKAGRNIDMLRKELLERPDDINLKAFLADALVVEQAQECLDEGERLYLEVVHGVGVHEMLKKKAYRHLIANYLNDPGKFSEGEALTLKAMSEFPDEIDMWYYHGSLLNMKGDFQSAWQRLTACEGRLVNATSIDESSFLLAKPSALFFQLAVAAQGLGDLQGLVRYSTIVLKADNKQLGVLGPYLGELLKRNTPEEEVRALLSKMYDMENPQDLLIIARAAKECGAFDFARKILAETGAALGNSG
ncbi:MAG: glycosyltransferase family 2 protein [Oscillospiraceae bacterium]|nr:glycosyltransferase family 2 protein [Oscillospiraceae bacterium]